ncbi:MAG TPA: class I SAM-dependent methyltransferase [Casimicrobiaceae bacterium]|jgi:SAM-dependent methyltransferase|nr:class I SAM-dependent methyltransferase [Casimicrobiaceae bacterium]
MHDASGPSPWIVRFAPLVAPGARVLDVAAGRGRHARFFASRGARVLAVDRDAHALASVHSVAGVETRVADLEGPSWPLDDATFDAIVVVHYLHRPSFERLVAALAPDGVLLYETFAAGNERYGRPSSPAFLLASDELLARVRGSLIVVAFEQGLEVDACSRRVVQRIAAVGPGRAWPPSLPTSG